MSQKWGKKEWIATSTVLLAIIGTSLYLSHDPDYGSVFGVKSGMSLEEVKKLGLGRVELLDAEDEGWIIHEPTKPKGATAIVLHISPKLGTLRVAAGWEVPTEGNGSAVKEKYKELRNILQAKYGEGKEYDFLMDGSAWTNPAHWMIGLVKKERHLNWFGAHSTPQYLDGIELRVTATDEERATVMLLYELNGWEKYVMDRLKSEGSEF